MGSHAACTIVSKNYIAFARVLARSYLEHHPGHGFFVLLVDRLEGAFDPAAEPFTLIEVEQLDNIPDVRGMMFKYTQLEANTAVKPYFLDHLFRRHQLETLLYLDPDIEVFQRFETLYPVLERRSIVLVPHLTAPIEDERKPSELDILKAGTYNLGFLGLRRTETSARFLRWWQERLFDRCVVAFEQGLFVDQRWIDLVPGLFHDVELVLEPGYDVAYWNLHEREVTAGQPPTVNGQPLFFFHYSGIALDRLEEVSKHQTRFTLDEIGGAKELYLAYRERLLAQGFAQAIGWPYAFGRYADGEPIEDLDRARYLAMGERRARFGDPFEVGREGCLRDWLDARRLRGRSSPAGLRAGLSRALKGAYDSAPGRVARRAGRRVLGSERTFRVWSLARELRNLTLGAPAPTTRPTFVDLDLEPGIDVTGYLRAETGVGEATRGLVRAMRTRGVPLGLHDLELNVLARREDHSLEGLGGPRERRVHLLYVNADQVGHVRRHLGPAPFEGRYNIGYWVWESTVFPEAWLPAFEDFAEIWTPSTWCADILSAVSPIPVRRVPHPVRVAGEGRHGRAHFGLPEDRFLVLFAFDFLSLWERKNPVAAIRAFRAAFAGVAGPHLVLKSANSSFDPEGRARIERELEGLPVTWIDRTLDREEVDDLFRCCDCYVSLHRAEGFGLTIAEAMYLGKPVVATAWSGNADFYNVNNGWPVRYRLVQLEEDVGPYPAGSSWAEPDLDHAAAQLRRVYEDEAERRVRVARAAADVRAQLSHDAVGALVEERYLAIERRLA